MEKQKQIIAIGGGTFSANMDDLVLENYILSQSRKAEPKICLLPTASGDSDSYIERFYRAFTTLNCKPSHFPLFRRTPNLRSVLLDQDIIYVGGGNTKSMLAVWRDWEIPDILKDAWNKGIVLAGSSAGAICWFEQGVTDSWDNTLTVIDGLGLLPGSCCPHYNINERKDAYLQLLVSKRIEPGLALCEWSAIHFYDNEHKALASRHDAKIYQVYVENKVPKENLLEIMLLP